VVEARREVAEAPHLGLDLGHAPAHERLVGGRVVQRDEVRAADQPLHVLHRAAQLLGQLRALLREGLVAGVHDRRADAVAGEGDEAQEERDHRDPHRRVAPAAPVEAREQAQAARGHALAVQEAVEVGGEVGGGGVALVRLLVQALADDHVERRGQIGRLLAERDRVLDEHLEQDVALVVLHEGRLAREQVVERRAQAVHVAPAVDAARVAPRLLGRHVARRPHHRARLGEALPVARLVREPEVHEHGVQHAAALGGAGVDRPLLRGALLDHDVRGLDVAVDDAEQVRRVHGLGDRLDHVHLLLDRHRLRGLGERQAVDELHGDVRLAGDLPHLEHLADVRVVDARLGAGLLEEAHRRVGVGVVEELDRRPAIEPLVARLVDGAHPAAAEQLDELVAVPLVDGGRAPELLDARSLGVLLLQRVVERRGVDRRVRILRGCAGAHDGAAHRGSPASGAARSTTGGTSAS
jgi:hypothetical protein